MAKIKRTAEEDREAKLQVIKEKDKCNICGYPALVEYDEWDEEAGETIHHAHVVPCLGHWDVHPSLWNKSKDYEKYQKYFVRERARSKSNETASE